MTAIEQIKADVHAWMELEETTYVGSDYGTRILECLEEIEKQPKIETRKGDLEAIKTAFHVCSNIATGGEMFIDGRKDYISAASSLADIKRRIEDAEGGDANCTDRTASSAKAARMESSHEPLAISEAGAHGTLIAEAEAWLKEALATVLKKPKGWRSRTVSDEERDALAGAIARRCGVYPFEIQAETIKDFYRSDADAAIAVLGLHRSAPKPQDEI